MQVFDKRPERHRRRRHRHAERDPPRDGRAGGRDRKIRTDRVDRPFRDRSRQRLARRQIAKQIVAEGRLARRRLGGAQRPRQQRLDARVELVLVSELGRHTGEVIRNLSCRPRAFASVHCGHSRQQRTQRQRRIPPGEATLLDHAAQLVELHGTRRGDRLSADQLGDDQPKREEIGAPIDRSLSELLGRHVRAAPRLIVLRQAHEPSVGRTEGHLGELHRPIFGNEDVGRADATVHEAHWVAVFVLLLVHVREHVGNALGDVDDRIDRDRHRIPLGPNGMQTSTSDELPREAHAPLVRAIVEDADEVRMGQRHVELSFAIQLQPTQLGLDGVLQDNFLQYAVEVVLAGTHLHGAQQLGVRGVTDQALDPVLPEDGRVEDLRRRQRGQPPVHRRTLHQLELVHRGRRRRVVRGGGKLSAERSLGVGSGDRPRRLRRRLALDEERNGRARNATGRRPRRIGHHRSIRRAGHVAIDDRVIERSIDGVFDLVHFGWLIRRHEDHCTVKRLAGRPPLSLGVDRPRCLIPSQVARSPHARVLATKAPR